MNPMQSVAAGPTNTLFKAKLLEPAALLDFNTWHTINHSAVLNLSIETNPPTALPQLSRWIVTEGLKPLKTIAAVNKPQN